MGEAAAAVVPGDVVIQVGDVPTGAAEAVVLLNAPVSDRSGNVSFVGEFAGNEGFVFWTDQVVWRDSDEAVETLTNPGGSGGAISATQFVYRPTIGGVGAVWSHNGLLAIAGGAAAGFADGTYGSVLRPVIAPNGAAYWISDVSIPGPDTRVLYRSSDASPGAIEIDVQNGDPLLDTTIRNVRSNFHVSDDGAHRILQLALDSSNATAQAVLLDDTVVLRGGDSTGAPEGDIYSSFRMVRVNDSASYAAVGVTNLGDVLVIDGTVGVRAGDDIDGFVLASGQVGYLGINNRGQTVHGWTYGGGADTLFLACDPSDALASSTPILSNDDTIDLDGDGVGDLIVASIALNTASDAYAFDDSMNVYALVGLRATPDADPVTSIVRIPTECCGDGFVSGTEACDDGNDIDTDACLSTCVPAVCGDGVTQEGVEECDDGNDVDTDACLSDCTAATCGDGVVQAGVEECDDGNDVDTDACPRTCLDARCGDGFVQDGVEDCDDGNDNDDDVCPNDCLLPDPGTTGTTGTTGGGTEGSSSGGSDTTDGGDTGSSTTGGPGTGDGDEGSGDDGKGSSDGETSVAQTSGADASTSTDTEGFTAGGVADDDGCSCKAGRGGPRGLGWSLLGLVMLGIARRRR